MMRLALFSAAAHVKTGFGVTAYFIDYIQILLQFSQPINGSAEG
jgi:hypothetical protein